MSMEEQERHKAEGLCFVCHKSGHFLCNCPDRNKVPSTSNKPLGVMNFGINVDFGDVKNQHKLSIHSQESRLAANNIHIFGDEDELDDESEPDDNIPDIISDDFSIESLVLSELEGDNTTESTTTGDYNPWIREPLAHQAEEQLVGTRYPGDNPLSPGVFNHARFCIYQVEGNRHIVIESEHNECGDGNSIYIPNDLLRNPHFDIVRWYWIKKAMLAGMNGAEARYLANENLCGQPQMGYAMEEALDLILTEYCPPVMMNGNQGHFSCMQLDKDTYQIWDFSTWVIANVPYEQLRFSDFDVVEWYTDYLECLDEIKLNSMGFQVQINNYLNVKCNKATPSNSSYSALERNAMITKDTTQTIPKPVVVIIHANGQPACALVNTRSLADFMSLNLAEQLKLKRIWLEKPLPIQLTIQGSQSKVNFGISVCFQYQGADYQCYFNVINLQNYDMILRMPFLYQHQALVGLNSSRLVMGSKEPREMKGPQVSVLESCTTEIYEKNVDKVRRYLLEQACPLCSQVGATALPPFRVINHSIPLIDKSKIYPW